MHECRHPHPRSTQQKRDHHNRGMPTHTHTHTRGPALRTWKEKEKLYVWSGWKAVSGGAGWVEDCAWRSMKVLGFNVSHVWEGPTGLWKSAKSCCQDYSRYETSHSPFYYPLSHIFKDLNAAKEPETDWLLSNNLAQMEAITCYKFV